MSEANSLPDPENPLPAVKIEDVKKKPAAHLKRKLTAKQREKLEEKNASKIDKMLKKSMLPAGVIFYLIFWNLIKPQLEKLIPDKLEFLYNNIAKNEKFKFKIFVTDTDKFRPELQHRYILAAEKSGIPYQVKWWRNNVFEANFTYKFSSSDFENRTRRFWAFVVSREKCEFREDIKVDERYCINSVWVAPMLRWEKNRVQTERNLAFDKKIEVVVDDTPHPYTYENATFDIVYQDKPIKETYLEYQNYKYIKIYPPHKFFVCPVSECRYMHVPIHRTWFNETQEINVTYHLKVQIKRWFLWDFQLANDLQPNENMKKLWDDIKVASVDNPAWLFWGYVALAMTRSIMKLIAFKEEIEWWSSLDNLKGISAQSIIFELFSEFVIILYLKDEDASFLDIVFKILTLVMTCYKFFKLFTPIMEYPYFRWNGGDDPETRQFDQEAGKYLYTALAPLLVGYTIYSLFVLKFKSWYSFMVKNAVNFVFAFGFLKMFPQVWVNYKLKTVAGISFRVLIYKLITTFIDDIYAIVMNMPFLYRIACFRDDIVFFIWVYQCFIYKIDYTRVNEYGEILEEPSDSETAPLAANKVPPQEKNVATSNSTVKKRDIVTNVV